MPAITALIADDEAGPRARLVQALAAAGFPLRLIEAANGADAWDTVLEHAPALCFLDVRMPGLTGIDVAQRIGATAHVVFVAAPSDRVLQELMAADVDHLRKPVVAADVASLLERLAPRLDLPPRDIQALLERLAGQTRRSEPLDTIRTGIGREQAVVRTDDIAYFESEGRHTRVVSRHGESLIRTPIKELVGQLDGGTFLQIDRHLLVNRSFIAQLDDSAAGELQLALAGRPERLVVAGRFRHCVQSATPR